MTTNTIVKSSARLTTFDGKWDKRNRFVKSIYEQARKDIKEENEASKLNLGLNETVWNRIALGKSTNKTQEESAKIKKNAVKFCIWCLGHAGFTHKEMIALFNSLGDRELVSQKIQISKTTKKDCNFMISHLTKLFS